MVRASENKGLAVVDLVKDPESTIAQKPSRVEDISSQLYRRSHERLGRRRRLTA